jgi:hypothetical protein
VVNTTATQATIGSTTIAVASATGLQLGQSAEGLGIQAGTLVQGVNGTDITISLPTTAVLNSTSVAFTSGTNGNFTGSYVANEEADVLLSGSVPVVIGNGTPQNNLAIYIRTVANANLPGTFVGGFEAADDVATAALTTTTTVGSVTLTTSASTGLVIGQRVTAPGVPSNTYLIAGSGTTWTMSQAATATTATQASSFANTALLGSSVDPWLVFSTGQIDGNNVAEITIKVRHSA